MNSFYEAALKVKRANHHIGNLERRITEFSATHPYSVHIQYDADAECDLLNVRSTKAIPDDILLVIGDAIHNLRASLDYAWHGVVDIVDEYTRFPFRPTRDALLGATRNTLTAKVSRPVLDLIESGIQPYGGGYGDLLWQLHQLDIEDKHRLLIAKTQVNFVTGLRAIDDRSEEFDLPGWMTVVGKTAHPYKIEGHRNCKITDEGQAACLIVFGEGMPMEGREIPATLRQMSILVNSTLGLLEIVEAHDSIGPK